jgi:hypothetical protein
MTRKIIKLITVISIITSIFVLQMTTAFAYERICYMTENEIYNEVWDMYVKRNYHGEDDFLTSLKMSITRGELKTYIHNYKPINEDVNVNDVKNDYDKYLSEELFKNTVIDEDSEGHIYEYDTDNPNEKFYWTYNESTDKFICRSADGKEIVKTYDRYYYNNGNAKETTTTSVTEYTYTTNNTSTNKIKISNKVETIPVQSTADEVKSSSNDNNTEMIIIITCVAVGGIGGAIFAVCKNKKKKGK